MRMKTMSRDEKVKILAKYFESKVFAETIVDKLGISDELVLEKVGKKYTPLTDN